MGKISIEIYIQAPIERCFDLSRSVDLHIESASWTGEIAIAGITKGLMGASDVVTWRARHFWIRQELSTQITIFDRPKHFRDSQTKGVFKRFDHDHYFEPQNDGTLVKDVFDFECPLGPVGKLADFFVGRHLEKFLKTRNQLIKKVAESDDWQSFI